MIKCSAVLGIQSPGSGFNHYLYNNVYADIVTTMMKRRQLMPKNLQGTITYSQIFSSHQFYRLL